MGMYKFSISLLSCFIICLCLSLPSFSAGYDEKTVVGQWLFDDEGENAIDSSGNGHDGQIKGGNNRVDGKFGTALQVSGNWVMVPPDDKLKLTAYTVTLWLNTKSGCADWCGILSKSMDNPTRTYCMYIDARTGVAGMSIGNKKAGKWSDVSGKTQINKGKWTHVAISYDEKEQVQRIYTNGILEGEAEVKHDLPQNDANLVFMAWHHPGGNAGITGMLDEIGLFNTVLDDAVIKTIHDKGLGESMAVDPKAKLATKWSKIKNSP
ncbi:MAG: LamG domain-containing protein [Candidatus Poribacteria bacterium]|nr:LamG domain-containing protein [Candidatus Poribacteria bacterium]